METPRKLRGTEVVLVGPLALRREYLSGAQHQELQAAMEGLVRGLQVGCLSAAPGLSIFDLHQLAPAATAGQFLREPMSTARGTRAQALVQGDVLTDTRGRLEMHLLLYDLASGALLSKKSVYAQVVSDLVEDAAGSGQELCEGAVPSP